MSGKLWQLALYICVPFLLRACVRFLIASLPSPQPLEILAFDGDAIAETPLSAVHNLGDLHLDQ